MAVQGWKNRITWQVWVHISNDRGLMSDLRNEVVFTYKNHLPSSIFSRRIKATDEIAEAARKRINAELNELPWFYAMDSWAKSVLNSALDDADWPAISKLLIENHEYAHNLEVRL